MRTFPRLWALILLLLPLGTVARACLWLAYSGHDRPLSALLSALAQGLRYDLVVGAVASLAIAVLVAPLHLQRARPRLPARTAASLGAAVLTLSVLAAACEHYYYGFYQTRFDPIVFGLFDDDTQAVLATIWDDYPVVPVLGAAAALSLALAWALARIAAWLDAHWLQPRWTAAAAVLQVLALVMLARGTFGTFPLSRQDLTLSTDPFVNTLVLNAPLTLYKAYKANKRQVQIGDDPAEGLKDLGFPNLSAAAEAAGARGDGPDAVEEVLFKTAPGESRSLEESPHVVLALLESFGNDLLYYDGPTNDLLGRLRPQLEQGYRFTNFVTGSNGTHPQLENLLLGSPVTPLTLGAPGRIPFDTSSALPFHRAGYRTAFLYAGGSSWRNVGRAFSAQGFDRVYDSRDIRSRFPDAHGSEWGTYDQYVFDFAAELLEQADARGERLFLFVLTTTNHPPFTLDTPHRQLPLDPGLLGARADSDKAELLRTLATYQYQADQFGAFLERVTRDEMGERVVVAAAGDHNLRTHFRYRLPAEQPDVDRVFGYLRVPPALRPQVPPDLDTFCTHGDLVPTLVSLALPGHRYFDTGRNLMDPAGPDDHALAMFQRIYTREGVLFTLRKPVMHPWQDDRHVDPVGRAPEAGLASLARRVAAQVALRDWHIRRQVIAGRDGLAAVDAEAKRERFGRPVVATAEARSAPAPLREATRETPRQ